MDDERALTVERLLAERAWVRRLAGALVRDAWEADDVAQAAMVAAIEGAPDRGGRRAWLPALAFWQRPASGSGAPVAAVVGAIAMKKWAAAVVVVLLLFGAWAIRVDPLGLRATEPRDESPAPLASGHAES